MKGIHKSSCLSTHTWDGNIVNSAMVSQAEVCLHITM